MLLPRKEDSIHKAWLLRLLTAICEHSGLSQSLGFKGGTCAAMRGFLERFSVDLDFDFLGEKEQIPFIKECLKEVFFKLKLNIQDESAVAPQFFLKYPIKDSKSRNTIKIDIAFPPPKANKYEMVRLVEIDRIVKCQTLQTMVANKMVALIKRYERTGKIAGRDLFDLHYFFLHGYPYDKDIIIELRKTSLENFFNELINFIDKNVTNTLIDEDLNYLLPNPEFQKIRKSLKTETLMFLRDEVKRIKNQK